MILRWLCIFACLILTTIGYVLIDGSIAEEIDILDLDNYSDDYEVETIQEGYLDFQQKISFDSTKSTNKKAKKKSAITCRDEEGAAVDWWILYKLPKKSGKDKRSSSPNIDEGVGYAYILSSDNSKSWQVSARSIESPESIPGQTLSPLYSANANSDLFHVMFNDEHPDGPTSFDKGHTKGLVMADQTDLVWLIHSVPHYPPRPNQTYGYPSTGHRYGQTFLCLSMKTSENLDKIGQQFQFTVPYIYSTAIPQWMDEFPSMRDAANGVVVRDPPFFHDAKLSSEGGVNVISFAKFTTFGKDLYADLVAPTLRNGEHFSVMTTSLLVETWPNGPGKMASNCSSQYIVENIEELKFPTIDNEDFTTKHDHAKWAISLDPKKPFVCIGDINRMMTQFKRGGGTACFQDKKVWQNFKSTVKTIEQCPLPKH